MAGLASRKIPARWSPDWIWGLVLLAAVVLAYSPAWHAGFIWDDDVILTENPAIVGPLGFWDIWSLNAPDIAPITRSTFWLEHLVWGLAPGPYHVVTILLHGACAVTLWRVLRALKAPGAWAGAAIWALHPVQVESVAWVAEMKNTESGLFFLLSILFFVKWLRADEASAGDFSRRHYLISLLFGALAIGAKASTVILPVVLCLGAWWVEGRWRWRNVVRVAPLLLLAAIDAGVSIIGQRSAMAAVPDPGWERSWGERVAEAGNAVWFYLAKLIWPQPLMTIYPRHTVDGSWWISYVPLLGAILLLGLLWLRRESWGRPYFFVYAYFLTALLPVLGLANNTIFRYSLVFDHLQYLASMGPLALVGVGLTRLGEQIIPDRAGIRCGMGAALAAILGVLSWSRAWVYLDQETLWTDELTKNSDAWVAHNNLGIALFSRGQIDEAMAQYDAALTLNPEFAGAHNNRGLLLSQKGDVSAAMVEFARAFKDDPTFADAHQNLAMALLQSGKPDAAVAEFRKALELAPTMIKAYVDLSNVLQELGRPDEAIAESEKARAIAPESAAVHTTLGNALLQKGRIDEATAEFQRAVEIQPQVAEAHYNLGNALIQKGLLAAAGTEYAKAVELKPEYEEAHVNLGNVLLQSKRLDEAITQFQNALKLKPGDFQIHLSLGIAYAQKGEFAEAIAQFQEVLRDHPGDANAQKFLSQAQALTKSKAP